MEDSRTGHSQFLVARSDKGGETICGRMWCLSTNKKLHRIAGRKVNAKSIPEKPWMHILADFITKLPLMQGYDSILVAVDWLTKMVHFIPTMEKTSAEGLARLFRDNMWKLHGLPESIISSLTSCNFYCYPCIISPSYIQWAHPTLAQWFFFFHK